MESSTPPSDTAWAMSQENVEIVRRVNDAFHAADWDAALGLYDDEAELDMTRMLAGDVYHGPEEVRKFYTRWIVAWERFQAERLDLIDAGNAVVLVSRITGVGKGSGAEVQMRAADVFFVEDGRIVRHVGYPDAAEALADLGLST
jgi:ketosteroid isomerase-like protein